MSDTAASETPAGPNGKDPGAKGRFNMLPINVLGQYVKDLSFENPNAPRSLMPGQPQPQVDIKVDVDAHALEANVYEVVLAVRCEAKTEEAVVFIAEVTYGGVLALQGVAEEHHRAIVLIEGPRLLFPFVRSVVADMTREGGFPPLLLNPIDFADLYRQQGSTAAPPASAPAPTA